MRSQRTICQRVAATQRYDAANKCPIRGDGLFAVDWFVDRNSGCHSISTIAPAHVNQRLCTVAGPVRVPHAHSMRVAFGIKGRPHWPHSSRCRRLAVGLRGSTARREELQAAEILHVFKASALVYFCANGKKKKGRKRRATSFGANDGHECRV